jgi:cold shock CspA family protein
MVVTTMGQDGQEVSFEVGQDPIGVEAPNP